LPESALRRGGDCSSSIRVQGYPLFSGDIFKMFCNDLSRDPSQVKSLTPAQDGWQNFVWLGGCKNEDHVGRWFFQSFQQRVERLLCQHVDLVNNVDFEPAARREADVFTKFTDLIDAVITRAVDLEHIEADTL